MTAHQPICVDEAALVRLPIPWPLKLAPAILGALGLYLLCWPIVPPDMTLFLYPWYDHILQRGPVGAFAQPFSNYTPPYLYLLALASLAHDVLSPLHVIKLLSVAGIALLALAAADLLKALGANAKGAILLFLMPTAILNAALLGQCDMLWAGACLLAVAAMIRGNTVSSLLWCGVAIAFKAQSAFVAPFIIGALIGRRVPLWQWAIPGGVYAAMMLPAWLLGWPAADLATIYLRQIEHFDFPGNLANPWIWATEFAPDAATGWYVVGYAAAAAAAVAIGALAAGSIGKPKALLALALLSALTLPFVLPKMHERYLFLADVLAVALALTSRNRATASIAVGVQLTSLSALISYIYNWPSPALVGTLVGATALVSIYAFARENEAAWPVKRPAIARP